MYCFERVQTSDGRCPTYAFFVHESAKPVQLLKTDNNYTFSNYDV